MNLDHMTAWTRSYRQPTRRWALAERFLRRREVNLQRRLSEATSRLHAARLRSRLATVRRYQETIEENWGCLHGESAAACAAYSDHLVAKGEWEARTGERWEGD